MSFNIKITIISYISFSILLFSCEIDTEIGHDYSLPNKNYIMIHGFITGRDIEIFVNKSFPPEKIIQDDAIISCNVKLFENGVHLFDLDKKNSNLFKSPKYFTPRLNSTYHIVVNTDRLGKATSAEQKVHSPVKIDTIYKTKIQDNENLINIVFKFQDPKGEKNYYYPRVYVYPPDENESSFFKEKFYGSYAFDDKFTDGQCITKHFEKIYIYQKDSIKVELISLSEDLYLFLESKHENYHSLGNSFTNQPIPVYTNIKNGYGIFGSFTVDSMYMYLK